MLRHVFPFTLNYSAFIPKKTTTSALRSHFRHLQTSHFNPRRMTMSTQAVRDWERNYEQTNSSAANDFRSKSEH